MCHATHYNVGGILRAIRTVTGPDQEPWWVLADVCTVLEIRNPSDAASRLDDDERSRFNLGRQGEATIINESGLYSIILTSRKPSAKRFKKWVTSEVLPAIRKTGGYMVAKPDETPEEIMARAVLVEFVPDRSLSASVRHEFSERSVALSASYLNSEK